MNIYILFNLDKLSHHIFINVKTTSCIQDYNVLIVLLSMLNSSLSYINRTMISTHREYFNFLLLSINLKLFNSCWSIYIAGYKKWSLALLLKLASNLGCSSCFTSTLKTTHHNNCNSLAWLHCELCSIRSHKRCHLFINNLDNHLAWIKVC